MTEFAYAGNKEETLLVIAVFQNAVKPFKTLLNIRNIGIGNIVKNRLVIFVDQNDNITFRGGYTI